MAVPVHRDDVIALIRKSGVIDPHTLESFLQQHPFLPDDPISCIEQMVAERFLTPFQAKHLLAGRYKGLVLEQYRLLDQIGQGGSGVVFLGEHATMHRRVAIKVLPADRAKDEEALERFYRESRAVGLLDHPNIVRAHDANHSGTLHFIVMEYVEGKSLQELVTEHGALPYLQAGNYISQTASGLQHAFERGMVHRDIKPGNLVLDRTGVIKILDMGLCKFFQETDDGLTRDFSEGAALGTVDYMAPEQALDSAQVDTRADIYSLGATFYTLLTGKPPFHAVKAAQKLIAHQMRAPAPVREAYPEIPEDFALILDKMLAKKPADRYQTPGEVVQALAPFLAGVTATWPSAWFQAETDKTPVGPEVRGSEGLLTQPVSKSTGKNLRPATAVDIPVVKPHSVWPIVGGALAGLVGLAGLSTLIYWLTSTPQHVAPKGPVVIAKKTPDPQDDPSPFVVKEEPKKPAPAAIKPNPPKIDTAQSQPGQAFEAKRLLGHNATIDSVIVLPDGRLLSSGQDSTVRRWNVIMGKDDGQLPLAKGVKWRNLSLSADGKTLLTGGTANVVRFWEMPAMKEAGSVTFPGPIITATLLPLSKRCLAWGNAGSGYLCDADEKKPEPYLKGMMGPVLAQAILDDESGVVTAGQDGTVRLWNLESATMIWSQNQHAKPVRAVAVHQGKNLVVSTGVDGLVRTWRLDSGKEIQASKGHVGGIGAVAISPDGAHFATGGDDRSVILWDAATGKEQQRYPGHLKPITSVGFLPDGKVYSASQDGSIRIWAPTPPTHEQELFQYHNPQSLLFERVTISPSGRYLLGMSRSNVVRVWDLHSRRLIGSLTGHLNGIWTGQFDAKEERILTGGMDSLLRIYSVQGLQLLQTLKGARGQIWTAHFHADGKHVFSAGDDQIGRLWDLETGEVERHFVGHTQNINWSLISPDGSTIYTSGWDGVLRAWNAKTGEDRFVNADLKQRLNVMAWSADRKAIYAGALNGTIYQVNAQTGEVIRTYDGHKGPIFALDVSRDGQWMISGGQFAPMTLWRLPEGRIVGYYNGNTQSVSGVAFRPDLRRFISSSYDKTIREWEY